MHVGLSLQNFFLDLIILSVLLLGGVPKLWRKSGEPSSVDRVLTRAMPLCVEQSICRVLCREQSVS